MSAETKKTVIATALTFTVIVVGVITANILTPKVQKMIA